MAESEEIKKKTTKSRKTGKKTKKAEETVSKADFDKLQEEKAELNDKFVRLFAEFDNYKKRTAKERLEILQTASKSLIVKLLPVVDDFERALDFSKSATEIKAVVEGDELIFQKLKGILESEGLKPIIAKGEEFDTDFHEAITKIPAPDEDSKGKIVDEVEKGYTLSDKVIRFSKVVIGE
jgi:molecular chaperone GrpE